MVLVSIGAVVTAACSQVHADDFQISFAARAWYPVRKPDGHYDLHQITAAFGRPLVAMRSAVASLFQGDADAVYQGAGAQYSLDRPRLVVRHAWPVTLMGGITTPCRGADTLRPVTSFCAMMVGRSVQ
jgi:hypothetical protein